MKDMDEKGNRLEETELVQQEAVGGDAAGAMGEVACRR